MAGRFKYRVIKRRWHPTLDDYRIERRRWWGWEDVIGFQTQERAEAFLPTIIRWDNPKYFDEFGVVLPPYQPSIASTDKEEG